MLEDAAKRSIRYREGLTSRGVAPSAGAVAGLSALDEPTPDEPLPPQDVLRLLKEQPDAIGLTVPGMPVGSPGMDGPQYGTRRDPYDVLLVARDGSTRIFSSYR